MEDSLKEISKTKQCTQQAVLNLMNLLLRYGLSGKVCSLSEEILKNGMNEDNFLEAQLIKEIALFHTTHLGKNNFTQKTLVRLVKKALRTDDLSTRIKILALNFFIVLIYRFGMKLDDRNLLKESYVALELSARKQSAYNFGDKIRESVAYRGLAMITEVGKDKQNQFLKDAELIARNIKGNNSLEKLILKENLYTCLQSLAKWNIYHNQLDFAYSNLTEMISLDPFDSTAYAEMGFFLFQQNVFKEASSYFKKAISLGPPAVGMHTYYYAKCLQELGKKNAAYYLHQAAAIDKEAISPWLDLIDHYLGSKEIIEATKIAKRILKIKKYREQLEKDETTALKKMISDRLIL